MSATRAATKRLLNAAVKLHRAWSPSEREFRTILPLVNLIEGYLQSPKEERWLFKAARSLPHDAQLLEIGSYFGRSTACLAFGCRGTGKRVFALDLFAGDGKLFPRGDFLPAFLENIRRCSLLDRVTPIRGSAHTIAKEWARPIQLLFIDGSHEYEDVRLDFEAFFPHVVDGGIVVFHDATERHPGVMKVWLDMAMPLLVRTGKCGSLAFGRKRGSSGRYIFFEELLYSEKLGLAK